MSKLRFTGVSFIKILQAFISVSQRQHLRDELEEAEQGLKHLLVVSRLLHLYCTVYLQTLSETFPKESTWNLGMSGDPGGHIQVQ